MTVALIADPSLSALAQVKQAAPSQKPRSPILAKHIPLAHALPERVVRQNPLTEETIPALTDAEILGAATAESGEDLGSGESGAGGRCNMARLLQTALRKDPLVQAAARAAAGRPLMIWNGDWMQSSGEDGKGLAAVREAIMWAVGFAPAACRNEPVRGLVMISLNGAPGSPRLVMGAGGWRWSDLLIPGRYATVESR